MLFYPMHVCENDYMNFLDDNERLDKKPEIYDALSSFGTEELFTRFRAQEWIDKYRVEHSDGAVDMFGTVGKIGIPLAPFDEPYEADPIITKAYVTGVSTDAEEPIRIHISPLNMDDKARYSFGHELGHFFLYQQGYLHDDPDTKLNAERFCDAFGQEVALPLRYMESIDRVDGRAITKITEMFQTSYSVVFTQLMRANKLPKVVMVDTSFGETANPLYNNRLTRIAVCYDCEMGTPHDPAPKAAPIIDMTYESAAFKRMSSCVYSEHNPLDISLIEAIERQYGRHAAS